MAVVKPDVSKVKLPFIGATRADRHFSCDAKAKYPSEERARETAARSLKLTQKVKALYVYPCPLCRRWHLTRRNNGYPAVTR